mgnify:CR=1 FL=1
MRTLFLFFTLLLSLNSHANEAIQLDSITVAANKDDLMNSDYQVFQREDFINRYQNLSSFFQTHQSVLDS